MKDDREEFRMQRRERVAQMARDRGLRQADDSFTAAADEKGFAYVWEWLGVPVIQMPTDIVVMQEIIWRSRPQLVIEAGVARGGSVVLYASILELLGEGLVLGIDVDIRPHNRETIETHPLAHRIVLVEGSSTAAATVAAVRQHAARVDRVMVVLDSNHTHDHVLQELRSYGPLVTEGQSLVVADTIVERVPPRPGNDRPWGPGNNPATAVSVYLEETDRFEVDSSIEGKLLVSSSRGGYLIARK